MTVEKHLVVFAKAPRLGRVKSRLAAEIGRVPAWMFYRATLAALLRRLDGRGEWRAWLALTPDGDGAAGGVDARGWTEIGQGGGDLGARMGRVMRTLPPGPAVIVGTDIPDISRSHIRDAFRALGARDAVFGPAADGGYWLVGQRRRPVLEGLFAGVRWSTEHALADTEANLPPGRAAARLEVLEDVDDRASLDRWRESVR